MNLPKWTALEWRKGTWYRWTLNDDGTYTLAPLADQPPAPTI